MIEASKWRVSGSRRASNFAIGVGELMWIGRIARQWAIYDASATARTFAEGRIIEGNEESGEISGIE